jgi:hypothetical protein
MEIHQDPEVTKGLLFAAAPGGMNGSVAKRRYDDWPLARAMVVDPTLIRPAWVVGLSGRQL